MERPRCVCSVIARFARRSTDNLTLTSQPSGPGPFPCQKITRSSSGGIARRLPSGEGPANLVAHRWLASCGWRRSCNWHSYLQEISRFQQPCRCRAPISSTIAVSPMSTTRSPRSAGTGGANLQSRKWSWPVHFVEQITHDPSIPADCLGQPLNWNGERLFCRATNFSFGSISGSQRPLWGRQPTVFRRSQT